MWGSGEHPPSTAISKAAASLPGSQQAWLLSASFQGSNILLGLCPPNSSCSFPVVLLAEGMLRWGGGLLPLGFSSPYYISLQPNTPGVW